MAHVMSFKLDSEDGSYLVSIARAAIKAELGEMAPPDLDRAGDMLRTSCGVFVTLNKVQGSSHELRGCIGYPYPHKPLIEATAEMAISAALKDPRFEPVSLKEMGAIAVEVSVLTPPERIEVESPMELPGHVEVGVDGLIVSKGVNRGLLLPQVAVDWGWDAEEFLTQCCLKANLPPDSWLIQGTEVSKFKAIIFKEEEPGGPVKRVELRVSC